MAISSHAAVLSGMNLVFSLAQPLATQLHRATEIGRAETDETDAYAGPVTPAGGAFAIWLPLFIAGVVFSSGMSRPGRHNHPDIEKVEMLAATAFAADTAWTLQAQVRGLGWSSVALIGTAAGSAISAVLIASRHAMADSGMRFAARWLGGLAGWLSVASFANLEATLNRQYRRPLPAAEERRSARLVYAAGAVASLVTWMSRGNMPYAAAAGWGLGGIALRSRRESRRTVEIAALVAGTAVVVVAAVQSRSRRS